MDWAEVDPWNNMQAGRISFVVDGCYDATSHVFAGVMGSYRTYTVRAEIVGGEPSGKQTFKVRAHLLVPKALAHDTLQAELEALVADGRPAVVLLSGGLDSTTVASEKEFLSSLLANLALEEENCSKIVQSGGRTSPARGLASQMARKRRPSGGANTGSLKRA